MPLMVLRFGLEGCQPLPVYPTREALDGGFGSAMVRLGSDDCPGVSFTATPAEARIAESIQVVAVGTSINPGASLTYAWTATNGYFFEPDLAHTTYVCPGRLNAGPQTITVSVSDGTCTTTRKATVICVALADGGGPATVGPTPEVDAGANCSQGDPTTCEGVACNDCTNTNCNTLATASAQGQGAFPTAGCDIFLTDDEATRCRKLYACMRGHGCIQNSDPTPCWCGSVDTYECETGMTPPNGPCVREINDAAGSSDATVINDRLTNAAYPLGGALNLAACRSASCSKLSDPPNPVCAL